MIERAAARAFDSELPVMTFAELTAAVTAADVR